MKIILLLFIFSFSHLSASEYLRAKDAQECFGECSAFRDSNFNKICDRWEKINDPKKTKKTIEKYDEGQQKISQLEVKVEKKNPSFYERLVKYGLFWFFIITCLAIAISERLKKNPNYLQFHKDIWNNILFLSFFLCSLSGFALYFFSLGGLKKIFFKIHLFSAVVCFFASLYHFLERYRCMFPFSRR